MRGVGLESTYYVYKFYDYSNQGKNGDFSSTVIHMFFQSERVSKRVTPTSVDAFKLKVWSLSYCFEYCTKVFRLNVWNPSG